jgi:hypothetical protein
MDTMVLALLAVGTLCVLLLAGLLACAILTLVRKP